MVAYGSRLLSKAERNYCVLQEKNCWQWLHSLYTFAHTSWDTVSSYVLTMHPCSGYIVSKSLKVKLPRWLEKLQEFDFEVTHRRGLRHVNADALS